MPRSAIDLVTCVMFADQRPWKTRSEALKPNQLVPVSQTWLPASSTIWLPRTCSQSLAGTAASAGPVGRAAGRGRGEISVVAVLLKKKNELVHISYLIL